jgi:hypothetical protein
MSAEHFLSRCILEFINRDGVFEVSGFPWQTRNQTNRPSPASLASKVLCDRHNGKLSSLDDAALSLFHALDRVRTAMTDESHAGNAAIVIDGGKFERWVLKAAFGALASGNGVRQEGRARKLNPPLAWLNVLFGRQPMPSPFGLFLSSSPGEQTMARTSVGLQLLFDERGPDVPVPNLAAVACDVNQFRFRLALCRLRGLAGTPFENGIYRPHHLTFAHANRPCKVKVLFNWKDSPQGGFGFDVAYTPKDMQSAPG